MSHMTFITFRFLLTITGAGGIILGLAYKLANVPVTAPTLVIGILWCILGMIVGSTLTIYAVTRHLFGE